jgi:hypothetical protein
LKSEIKLEKQNKKLLTQIVCRLILFPRCLFQVQNRYRKLRKLLEPFGQLNEQMLKLKKKKLSINIIFNYKNMLFPNAEKQLKITFYNCCKNANNRLKINFTETFAFVT